MDERGLAPDAALVAALHGRKNATYAELVASGAVTPRPGVLELIAEARARGIRLAIATTTSRANLAALLAHGFGPDAWTWFAAIVTGEDVTAKKPDPEVYRRVLATLDVSAAGCVAIEDSRHGLDAARACGIATVVTPSRYTRWERFDGATHLCEDLRANGPVGVDALEALL